MTRCRKIIWHISTSVLGKNSYHTRTWREILHPDKGHQWWSNAGIILNDERWNAVSLRMKTKKGCLFLYPYSALYSGFQLAQEDKVNIKDNQIRKEKIKLSSFDNLIVNVDILPNI